MSNSNSLPRIDQLEVIPLIGATVDGGWPRGHEPQDNLHTLVRIRAEGLTGWGSCFTSATLVRGAVELLWPWMRSQPVEPEKLSETLRQSTFWQGRGGSVEHAISGIDIALWDLFGQICGQPVSRLMGGVYRERIQPYGSILFDEPDPLRATLEEVLERGSRAIKLGWRPFGRENDQKDQLLVRTARETVGDDVTLMVDAGGSEEFWPHGRAWARRTAEMLADYNIAWFEEPLAPDDIGGYAELTRVSPVPIAGGEVLTRRQSFQPWIEQRAVDILQPDATKCGGLTEARRIAWEAMDRGVQFVSHGWNTAVGLAADLQLAAALPNARYVEFLTPCLYIDQLLDEPPKLDSQGMLDIPDTPGIGVTISDAHLENMSGDIATFKT